MALHTPAWNILEIDEAPSTNTYCIRHHLPAGSVIRARHQTAGRGRYGRTWISSPDDLMMSIVINNDFDGTELTNIALLAGLSVIEALEALKGSEDVHLKLKWPNDIFMNGRKLGGILVEGHHHDQSQLLILGIGINVVSHPVVEDARYQATHLHQVYDPALKAADVMKAILTRISANVHHFKNGGIQWLHPLWKQRSLGFGERIVVVTESSEKTGIFEDISPSGAAVIKLESNEHLVLSSGHIFPHAH